MQQLPGEVREIHSNVVYVEIMVHLPVFVIQLPKVLNVKFNEGVILRIGISSAAHLEWYKNNELLQNEKSDVLQVKMMTNLSPTKHSEFLFLLKKIPKVLYMDSTWISLELGKEKVGQMSHQKWHHSVEIYLLFKGQTDDWWIQVDVTFVLGVQKELNWPVGQSQSKCGGTWKGVKDCDALWKKAKKCDSRRYKPAKRTAFCGGNFIMGSLMPTK